MSLCKYKNVLGIPEKGIHQYRLFGIAIVDVVMTIIAAYIISIIFRLSFSKTAIVLFLLGIVLHRLFCVRTTLDKMIFPNAK
jgi:hypothetical protein